MEKCVVKPTSPDYSINLPTNSISILLNGGKSKVRRTIAAKSKKANITWLVGPCDYSYLIAFYLMHTTNTFNIDLISEAGTLQTKICRFVGNTFSVSMRNSQSFTIKATLEILQ